MKKTSWPREIISHTCSTRKRKNHQGSWSGINLIVCSYPFIGHLAKVRDEHLHFRAVYITAYGKENESHSGESNNRRRIPSADRNLTLIRYFYAIVAILLTTSRTVQECKNENSRSVKELYGGHTTETPSALVFIMRATMRP